MGDQSSPAGGGGPPKAVEGAARRFPAERTRNLARRLRRDLSLPEVLLWQALRQRPEGLRFRRQHPVGPYVADFYCSAAKLVIEIDGESHNRGDRPDRDSRRDVWMAAAGYAVLRIPAKDVLAEPEAAVRTIAGSVLASHPLHHAASRRGPPPPTGEELSRPAVSQDR